MSTDFLNTFISDEQYEDIPSGGGFVPFGLISKWIGGIVYRVGWTEVAPDVLKEDGVEVGQYVESGSGKYRYYLSSLDMAQKAQEVIGSDYEPDTVWRFETSREDVLNFGDDDIKERFSEVVSMDVLVKTPRSKKYRHEFQLISLPHAVQALALATGAIDEPLFDTNELISADVEFDDELQKFLIGDPDGGAATDMLASCFGERRTELWAKLGEGNPLAYINTDKGQKSFRSTSDAFGALLNVYASKWKNPAWLEIVSFPDPRVDAEYDSGGEMKRPRVPAIVRFFADESAAQKAAEEQLENRADHAATTDESEPVVSGDAPSVPEAWADLGTEEFVSELKAAHADKNGKAALVANDMTITKDEASAWFEHLGL